MVFEALSGLLDEKLVKIISVFMDHPEKKFHLSEISRVSGINNASTFRIVNKLLREGFLSAIVIGKVRAYQLAKNEKVSLISGLITKGSEKKVDGLDVFVKRIESIPRIKRIILDSRADKSAKVIIISDYFFRDRIERICKEVFNEEGFRISFAELTPQQFEDMGKISGFAKEKKVLFRRS